MSDRDAQAKEERMVGNETFYTSADWEDFECGTGTPYGPIYLGLGGFFSPCAVDRPTQAELGLCRNYDREPIFDRLTQLCKADYLHHLQRREEREWERNYGLQI